MARRASEQCTRKDMIDPQLEQAGWCLRDLSMIKIEIPVLGHDAEPLDRIMDDCLYHENGGVLVVVDAKKTAVDVTATAFLSKVERMNLLKCTSSDILRRFEKPSSG